MKLKNEFKVPLGGFRGESIWRESSCEESCGSEDIIMILNRMSCQLKEDDPQPASWRGLKTYPLGGFRGESIRRESSCEESCGSEKILMILNRMSCQLKEDDPQPASWRGHASYPYGFFF